MKTSTLHIVRLVTAASFLPLTGCAMWPQFGEPAFVGPPEPPVLTAEQSPTDRAKDPSGVTPLPGQDYGQNGFEIIFLPRPLPEDKPPVRKRPPTPPVAAAPAAADTLTAAAESTSAPSPVDSAASAPPPVTVAPRGTESERAVRADLEEAQRLLRRFDSSDLIRADKENLRAIYSLIAQAQEALARRDVAPAAGLARKARLLAEELTSP